MKQFHPRFIYLVIVAGLILALSTPASPSAAFTTQHATLLESIQLQLNEIFSAIARIQLRIAELIKESAPVDQPVEQTIIESPAVEVVTEPDAVATVSASDAPVWKFMPLPSTYLAQPLAILYRFSIAGGAADAVIPSVTYTITLADVSIKDLEVYAFSDDLFSAPAFLNSKATKRNRVGKQSGYVDSRNQTVTILLDQSLSSQITIPVGETYYFELRGTVVGKNRGASAIISAEGLSAITLE